MTQRRDLAQHYPDLLGEHADPDLVTLVDDLDRACAGPIPAARIDAALALALQQRTAAQGQVSASRAAMGAHSPRRRAARASWKLVLLVALLICGGSIAAAAYVLPRLGIGTVFVGPGPLVLRTIVVGGSPHAVGVDARAGRAFVITDGDPVPGRAATTVVRVLDMATGAILRTVPVGIGQALGSDSVAVDERGGRAFIITPNSSRVSVLDTHSGRLLRRTQLGQNLTAVAIDAAGARVLVTRDDGALSVLDAHSGLLLHTIMVGAHPVSLAVDTRLGRAFVANTGLRDSQGRYKGAASVSVLDVRGDVVLHTVSLPQSPAALVVDERAGHVFVTTGSGVIMLDAATGRVLRRVAVPGLPVAAAVDEWTGRVFVLSSTGNSGDVSVLDAGSGAVLRRVAVAPRASDVQTLPNAIAVDGERGRVFVSYEQDQTGPRGVALRTNSYGGLRVLDALNGAVLRTVRRPGPGLGALAVDTRTGHAIVINTFGTTVAIIDVAR